MRFIHISREDTLVISVERAVAAIVNKHDIAGAVGSDRIGERNSDITTGGLGYRSRRCR